MSGVVFRIVLTASGMDDAAIGEDCCEPVNNEKVKSAASAMKQMMPEMYSAESRFLCHDRRG